MTGFKIQSCFVVLMAGVGVAWDAQAIPVPDTQSTCANNPECFKITNNTLTGIAIRATGNTSQGYGLYAEGGAFGVYATTNQSTGYAVKGVTNASGARGVEGFSGLGIGVHGFSGGDSSYGVFGEAVGNSGKGVYGNASGTTSYGVYGHSIQSTGVYGVTDSSGAYGVYGSSSNGIAVRGIGSTRGVAGQSTAPGSIGVSGVAPSGQTAAKGVYGAVTPQGIGSAVYGENPSTLANAWAGYFWGNVRVTGTITEGNSDSRLKKNIQPIEHALDRVTKLRGVSYEWNEPDQHTGPGTHLGFVAQDVEKVFPEWVGVDEKGFRTLRTNELDGLVVESIRALKSENDALRKRLDLVEGRRDIAAAGLNGNGLLGLGLVVLGSAIIISRRRTPAPSV